MLVNNYVFILKYQCYKDIFFMYTDTDPQNVLNYGKLIKRNNEKPFLGYNNFIQNM